MIVHIHQQQWRFRILILLLFSINVLGINGFLHTGFIIGKLYFNSFWDMEMKEIKPNVFKGVGLSCWNRTLQSSISKTQHENHYVSWKLLKFIDFMFLHKVPQLYKRSMSNFLKMFKLVGVVYWIILTSKNLIKMHLYFKCQLSLAIH